MQSVASLLIRVRTYTTKEPTSTEKSGYQATAGLPTLFGIWKFRFREVRQLDGRLTQLRHGTQNNKVRCNILTFFVFIGESVHSLVVFWK